MCVVAPTSCINSKPDYEQLTDFPTKGKQQPGLARRNEQATWKSVNRNWDSSIRRNTRLVIDGLANSTVIQWRDDKTGTVWRDVKPTLGTAVSSTSLPAGPPRNSILKQLELVIDVRLCRCGDTILTVTAANSALNV